MRVTTSFGALVASSLLSYSVAQAPDYGSFAHYPSYVHWADNCTSDLLTACLGTGPDGDTTATLGGYPGASSNGPTCVMQAISTVFVTVYPTNPASPADGSIPDQSQEDLALIRLSSTPSSQHEPFSFPLLILPKQPSLPLQP